MALNNPRAHTYERILMYGPYTSGKTYNWLRIARLSQRTKSKAKFYVIDTDNAVRFTIAQNEMFQGLESDDGGNVVILDAYDWNSYTNAVEQVTKKAKPEDWAIWDKLSDTWEWVQDHYTNERYGMNQAEYFLDWRTKHINSKANELEGDTDWKVIKALYRQYVVSRILRGQYNVFATASAKATSTGGKTDTGKDKRADPKEILAVFAKMPLRPEGNKETGHMFHSIFMVQEKPKGFQIVTVRERAGASRPYYEGDDWTDKDFATNYLVGKAGWKLK